MYQVDLQSVFSVNKENLDKKIQNKNPLPTYLVQKSHPQTKM